MPTVAILAASRKGGEATITISDQSIITGTNPSATRMASYNVNNTGTITKNNLNPIFLENWISDISQISNFQIKATKTAGTNPSGSSLATWLDLSTSRQWISGIGSNCTLTVEIRNKTTLVVKDTATVYLETTGEGGGPGGP